MHMEQVVADEGILHTLCYVLCMSASAICCSSEHAYRSSGFTYLLGVHNLDTTAHLSINLEYTWLINICLAPQCNSGGPKPRQCIVYQSNIVNKFLVLRLTLCAIIMLQQSIYRSFTCHIYAAVLHMCDSGAQPLGRWICYQLVLTITPWLIMQRSQIRHTHTQHWTLH